MTEYEGYITTILNYYKRMFPITIKVVNDHGEHIANLVSITKEYRQYYQNLPKLLGMWRMENPSLSTSKFVITEENTTNWLDNLVIGRKDRILFIIHSLDMRPIGHIGYSSFDFIEHTAEIDCVLRGEMSPVPKLMHHTLNAMLEWGKKTLLLKKILLSVNKENPRAIKLYKDCGFEELYDIPLFKRELPNGEIRWDEDKNRNPADATKFGIMMQYMEDR